MDENRKTEALALIQVLLRIITTLVVMGILIWVVRLGTHAMSGDDIAIRTAFATAKPVPAPRKTRWCSQAPDHDCAKTACASGKRVIILFEAKWCGWCRHLKTKVLPDPEVRKLLGKFFLIDVDSEKNPELIEKSGVESYPTWFIFEKGCEKGLDTFSGTPRTPKDFVKRFKVYLTR